MVIEYETEDNAERAEDDHVIDTRPDQMGVVQGLYLHLPTRPSLLYKHK